MSEPICDHSCDWHLPVNEPEKRWVQVSDYATWNLDEMRSRTEAMPTDERRRVLSWLIDEFSTEENIE